MPNPSRKTRLAGFTSMDEPRDLKKRRALKSYFAPTPRPNAGKNSSLAAPAAADQSGQ